MAKSAKSPKRARRAAAKDTASAPRKTTAVPKKATRKYPAAFADMLRTHDELTDKITDSLDSLRSTSERKQRDVVRAAAEQRQMLLDASQENAQLRDHADDVETAHESLIAAVNAAIEASQRRDFSAEKLDPLAEALKVAKSGLDELRKARADIYVPAKEPAANETLAATSAAAAPAPPETPAAAASEPIAPEQSADEKILAAVSAAVEEIPPVPQPPAQSLWRAQPPRTFDPPALEPIRTQRAQNSVKTIARAPGFWKGAWSFVNAVRTDKRSFVQHVRGEPEFVWAATGQMETRDGYASELRIMEDQRVRGGVWLKGQDHRFDVVCRVDAPTVGSARRYAERAIVSHRTAVMNATRFTAPDVVAEPV